MCRVSELMQKCFRLQSGTRWGLNCCAQSFSFVKIFSNHFELCMSWKHLMSLLQNHGCHGRAWPYAIRIRSTSSGQPLFFHLKVHLRKSQTKRNAAVEPKQISSARHQKTWSVMQRDIYPHLDESQGGSWNLRPNLVMKCVAGKT